MKVYLFLCLTILSQSLFGAKPQTLLECLGKEERDIHKSKLNFQAMAFNQAIISDLLNLEGVEIQKKYLKQICHQNQNLDSFHFLEVFLQNQGKVFIITADNAIERSSHQTMIQNFYNQVLDRLIQYISILQLHSPTAVCLTDLSPHISRFLFRVMFLRHELSAYQLLHQNNLGLQVIKELKKFPNLVDQCPPEQKR